MSQTRTELSWHLKVCWYNWREYNAKKVAGTTKGENLMSMF